MGVLTSVAEKASMTFGMYGSGSTKVVDNGSNFFSTAFDVLEILIVLIGGGLALWGIVNLLEGYGNDNPGAKSQGIKQLMSGAGIILVGVLLIPILKTMFTSNANQQA